MADLEPIEIKLDRVMRRLRSHPQGDGEVAKFEALLEATSDTRSACAYASTMSDALEFDPDRRKGAAMLDGARQRGYAVAGEAAKRHKIFRRRARKIRLAHPKWTNTRVAHSMAKNYADFMARHPERVRRGYSRRTIFRAIHTGR